MKMDKGIYKNYAIIYPELRMLEEKEEMNNVNQTIKIYKKEKDIDTLLSERMREKGRRKIAMPSITDIEIYRLRKIIEIPVWDSNSELHILHNTYVQKRFQYEEQNSKSEETITPKPDETGKKNI
ncbi:hypothetical protein Zmor_024973 [Zophobas morio]|uniref:Uncharacterized protein n=1 Tax=Zophobas morio TaxID=2755281 RepID=A0AA38HVU7_9CUCU|nr:hypothetical protein Zmor_024973 [Zophobas morio]